MKNVFPAATTGLFRVWQGFALLHLCWAAQADLDKQPAGQGPACQVGCETWARTLTKRQTPSLPWPHCCPRFFARARLGQAYQTIDPPLLLVVTSCLSLFFFLASIFSSVQIFLGLQRCAFLYSMDFPLPSEVRQPTFLQGIPGCFGSLERYAHNSCIASKGERRTSSDADNLHRQTGTCCSQASSASLTC